MKKSLLAFAVLGAFAGAASAQSAVTIYGVADIGLSQFKGQSLQVGGNGALNNGNSRLGFKGVEDLGNGLKAAFVMEQAVNLESGATGAGFDRTASLTLAGDFGSVALGRMYSTGFLATAAWELTGMANYSVAASQMFGANSVPGGVRNSSELRYTSPTFNGLTVAVGRVFRPDNANVAENGLNAVYANGPIAAGFAYEKTQNATKNWSLGGAYTFGDFKVAASYQDPADVGATENKGFTIGGGATFGANSIVLDIARQTGTNKGTDFLLEAKHALTKRTFAYAAYLRDANADNPAIVAAGGGKNNFGVGIRHNF